MSSLSARSYIIVFAGFVAFFVSAFADARLIRGGGRGSVSIGFPTVIALIPESELLPITGFLDYNFFENGTFDQVGTPPGIPAVSPVPDFCFQIIGPDQDFEQDPCFWQFFVGEQLQLTGFTNRFFASAAQHNISWNLFAGTGNVLGEQLFSLSAPFVSFEDTGDSRQQRELYLDAPMPANIAPGEYTIQLELQQIAPDGYVFYLLDQFQTPEQVIQVSETEVEVVRVGQVIGTSISYISRETLIVVPEPNSMTLLLFGLLALVRRHNAYA